MPVNGENVGSVSSGILDSARKKLEFVPQAVGYADVERISQELSRKGGEGVEEVSEYVSEALGAYHELDTGKLVTPGASSVVEYFYSLVSPEVEKVRDMFWGSNKGLGVDANSDISLRFNRVYGSDKVSKYSFVTDIVELFDSVVSPYATDQELQNYVKARSSLIDSLDFLYDACFNLDPSGLQSGYSKAIAAMNNIRVILISISREALEGQISDFIDLYRDYTTSIPSDYMVVAYGREPVEVATAYAKADESGCNNSLKNKITGSGTSAISKYEKAVDDYNNRLASTLRSQARQATTYEFRVPYASPVSRPLNDSEVEQAVSSRMSQYKLSVDSNVVNSIRSAVSSGLSGVGPACSRLRESRYAYYVAKYQKSGLWGVAERNVMKNVGGESVYVEMTKVEARPLLDEEFVRLINLVNKVGDMSTEVQDAVDNYPDLVEYVTSAFSDSINLMMTLINGALESQTWFGESEASIEQTEVGGGTPTLERVTESYSEAQSTFLDQLKALGQKYAAISQKRAQMDVYYSSYDDLDTQLSRVETNVDSMVESMVLPNAMNRDIWGAYE